MLKYLIKQRLNSRLTIIWEGAIYHKSQEFREYLELVNKGKSPEEWQINCILFAPNAREQNPVEDIWLQGKNLLRKFAYRCLFLAIVKRLFMFFLLSSNIWISQTLYVWLVFTTLLGSL